MSHRSKVRDKCETHASICNSGAIPRTSEVRDQVSNALEDALPPRPGQAGGGVSGDLALSHLLYSEVRGARLRGGCPCAH
jgi:hypothetical protein